MNINYTMVFIVIFGIFLINRNMNNGYLLYESNQNLTHDSIDINTKPIVTRLKESLKETISKINDVSPLKLKGISEEKVPISIIGNNYGQVVNTSNLAGDKDFISPNPAGTTEYRFIDENMKTAWSNIDVSQHPKYYTSDMEDEKINISGFFNKDNFFHDNTSPNSKTTLPERCTRTMDNEVICDYNNRLQLTPPKLITNSESNPLLNSIGTDAYKTVDSNKIGDVSGSNYQVWEYENEKSINGGKYFKDVYGSSETNETYMELGDIKPNYSF